MAARVTLRTADGAAGPTVSIVGPMAPANDGKKGYAVYFSGGPVHFPEKLSGRVDPHLETARAAGRVWPRREGAEYRRVDHSAILSLANGVLALTWEVAGEVVNEDDLKALDPCIIWASAGPIDC